MNLRNLSKDKRFELWLVLLAIALSFMVIVMGFKYNKLVEEYNVLIPEINDCRQNNWMEAITKPVSNPYEDAGIYFEYLDNTSDIERIEE